MPFAGYDDFQACVADNQDVDDPEAYCAEIKRKTESELSEREEKALDESACGEGHVSIDGKCVPVTEVDAPAPLLNSQPRVMASASPLDTQPIEREELSDGKVVYHNLKLIDEGVWTDSNSETPTLYDERTFENTQPEYDDSKHQGPPVNIAHDLHKNGPNAGEPHEASIGGYIDPDSLDTDGKALFGDLVLDRGTDAGAFADTNLKSALENDGTAGFSPSVELMPTELKDAEHSRAEEYVAGAELTGLGLVRDPASKSVDLAHETQNRAVALSSGEDVKTLHRQETGMSSGKQLGSVEEIREILSRFGLDVGDMDDEEVMDMAEDMHEDLMAQIEDGGEESEEGVEAEDDEEDEEEQEMEDGEDDEEDDEMEEMQEGGEVVDALQDQVASLAERLEDLEDKMATQDELSEAQAELAAADTVEELREAKDELDKRLSQIEDEGKDPKTLSDADSDEEFDWSDADGGIEFDPATGSMSR